MRWGDFDIICTKIVPNKLVIRVGQRNYFCAGIVSIFLHGDSNYSCTNKALQPKAKLLIYVKVKFSFQIISSLYLEHFRNMSRWRLLCLWSLGSRCFAHYRKMHLQNTLLRFCQKCFERNAGFQVFKNTVPIRKVTDSKFYRFYKETKNP